MISAQGTKSKRQGEVREGSSPVLVLVLAATVAPAVQGKAQEVRVDR
jgi:hypothetical protein